MTTQQIVVLAVAGVVGIASLIAAVVLWRRLAAVSRGLGAAASRLDTQTTTLPARLVDARLRLAETGAQAERALWALQNVDARIDRATADITAKRAASDRLRVRLIAGKLSIARLRELVRLAVRLSELRRAFL